MNKCLILVTAAVLLAAGPFVAEAENPATHSPEWTDHSESDPGITQADEVKLTRLRTADTTTESVIPELAGIVVLCATDQKEKFEKEWRKYVSDNDLKGEELQETIREVSDQAEAYRAREAVQAESGEAERAWKEERRQFMAEVARKVMNPVR